MTNIITYEDAWQEMYSLTSSARAEIVQNNLDTFIAANFAGGEYTVETAESAAQEALTIGIYSPVKSTKALHRLVVNKILLLDVEENEDNIEFTPELNIAAYRTVLAWQKILPEPVAELKTKLDKIVLRLNMDKLNINAEEKTLVYLEQAQAHFMYYEHDLAEQCISAALDNCGLENVELAGKMGKRTKFQQKELSQLVITATSRDSAPIEYDSDVPTNVVLDDDTVLETIALSEVTDTPESFTPDQLAVILALCKLSRRTGPMDDLLLEKCNAYLSFIISIRRCWAVQCAALLMRADLERYSKRRVERACSQSELIVKLMEGVDDKTPIAERRKRARYVLASGLEPIWHAKVVHAEILRSLGVTSEALRIYEQLELWDHVIDCYKSMNQLEKANNLIHELLKTRPNDSMLYVFLGDINQKESYYQKAIEISGDRNAKAHRAIGHMLLMRNQYQEAWKHLKRSVELQPVQFGVWFNAGHCAWKLEKYENAISCYHRCVCLEPDHFEAWNNLSAAYIRLGEKERAKLIIQESLKFNYEHPKVWENYLMVCVDTGDFNQAIHAFHRLLDLNKKQQDDEVLEIVAGQILEKLNSDKLDKEEKNELIRLKKEIITLLARITSTQTLSSKVWTLYAKLKKPDNDDITEYEKFLQLLERALSTATSQTGWEKDQDKCLETLQLAVDLCNSRFYVAGLKNTEDAQKQAKARTRMTLRPLLVLVERYYAAEIPGKVQEELYKVKSILESIQ